MAEVSTPREFGLGRGLDALIPPPPDSHAGLPIPLERIVANPQQPRARFDTDELDALAASIAAHGVLQPILVRGLPNGNYQLIAGERRVRAARQAGLTSIPAVVRDPSEEEMIELALVENLQRTDLNPLEEALGFRVLIDRFGMPHEAIAIPRRTFARIGHQRHPSARPGARDPGGAARGTDLRGSRPCTGRPHRDRAPGRRARARARTAPLGAPDRGARPTRGDAPPATPRPPIATISRRSSSACARSSPPGSPSPAPVAADESASISAPTRSSAASCPGSWATRRLRSRATPSWWPSVSESWANDRAAKPHPLASGVVLHRRRHPGPGGPPGRSQTAGHVHRFHRCARPAPAGVGGRRQQHRRGHGQPGHPDRRDDRQGRPSRGR